ncbi:hypothetical protein ACVBEF_21280, partial [Glaciimonas sp. GG7]
DAIDIEQSLYLHDFATRCAAFSQAIIICLNLQESNETYRSNPNPANAAALALSVADCAALKAFAVEATALLGEHAIGETEWVNTQIQTLRKARKAALNEAAQACND